MFGEYAKALSKWFRQAWPQAPILERKYLRGRSGFAKAVKSVILKTAEKKYIGRDLASNSAYDVLIGGNALNHNSVVETTLINNTNLIPLINCVCHKVIVMGSAMAMRFMLRALGFAV